jgi:hypothetical protein
MRGTVTSTWLHGALGLAVALAGAAPEPPTYAGAVAAILQKNDRECHRPGQVRPFSLET